MSEPEKMLSIRIGYDVGRHLKAVCALRGVSVRDVITSFAAAYVKHATELPPEGAADELKFAALSAAMNRTEAITKPPARTARTKQKA